jgi:3-hydroxyisobutyrate dehydrogenase-like beta-hydroxyacid dehydrogenase
MKRVSVIGLGLMGSAIARSLVRAGHTVTVWNRTSSRAEVIAAEGASVARDPAEAVAASQASIWCLLDYPIIAEVMNQPDVHDALAGKTAVPSATGGPDEVALVAEALASAGAHHVDAKIMFFPAQAGDPDAELLLSGDRAAYEANRDWLGDVGGIHRFLGPDSTAASVLYTAVWAYDFAARFAFMEAAALVEASGLSLQDFAGSASRRTAQFAAQNQELIERFARGDFDGDQATVDIYADGMAPMLGAYRRVDLRALMLDGVGTYCEAAARAGYGLKDVSVIFDMIRSRQV